MSAETASAGTAAQLDLFLDSRAVVLTHEIREALLARNATHAAALLRQATVDVVEHPDLPALMQLAQHISDWRSPSRDTQSIAVAVTSLENEWAPKAEAALGPRAPRLLQQYFRELSELAQGLAYDPAQPTAHRSSLCLRAGDFAEAEQAAAAIAQAQESTDVLITLVLARHRLHGLEAARGALFALAWHDPARVPAVLVELNDELLERDWRAFEIAADWDSVPAHELAAWFPAWYLMEHPAAAAEMDASSLPKAVGADAARSMILLLDLEKEGNSRALVAARQRLQRLNAEFFELYMARRKVRYG
jgi:hypothetical protein